MQKSEENLTALNEQEAILNKKRMEAFYIQDYIYFFNEMESFFFQKSYYQKQTEDENNNLKKDEIESNVNTLYIFEFNIISIKIK